MANDEYIVNAKQGLLLGRGTGSTFIGVKLNKSKPATSPVFVLNTYSLSASQEGGTLQHKSTGKYLTRSGTTIAAQSAKNTNANWDMVISPLPGLPKEGVTVFKKDGKCLTMEDDKTVTLRTYKVGQKNQQWWVGDVGRELADMVKMVKHFEDEYNKAHTKQDGSGGSEGSHVSGHGKNAGSGSSHGSGGSHDSGGKTSSHGGHHSHSDHHSGGGHHSHGEHNPLKGLGLHSGASNREIGEAIAQKLVSEFGLPLDQARYKAMLMWGNGSGAADARAFQLRSQYGFRGLSPGNYGTGDPYRLI